MQRAVISVPRQLKLPIPRWDEDSLSAFLKDQSGRNISLTLTDNATSLLSARQSGHSLSVRLHRMFLAADAPTLRELATYISTGIGKTPLFWRFVRDNSAQLKSRPLRRTAPRTLGTYHDLESAFAALNTEYFEDNLQCTVTWGRRPRTGSAKTRTLGSYSFDSNTIRISPRLDSRRVPGYYLSFVLYHEMLHAHMHASGRHGIKGENRRRFHCRDFRLLEQQYRYYEKALAWEHRYSGR